MRSQALSSSRDLARPRSMDFDRPIWPVAGQSMGRLNTFARQKAEPGYCGRSLSKPNVLLFSSSSVNQHQLEERLADSTISLLCLPRARAQLISDENKCTLPISISAQENGKSKLISISGPFATRLASSERTITTIQKASLSLSLSSSNVWAPPSEQENRRASKQIYQERPGRCCGSREQLELQTTGSSR